MKHMCPLIYCRSGVSQVFGRIIWKINCLLWVCKRERRRARKRLSSLTIVTTWTLNDSLQINKPSDFKRKVSNVCVWYIYIFFYRQCSLLSSWKAAFSVCAPDSLPPYVPKYCMVLLCTSSVPQRDSGSLNRAMLSNFSLCFFFVLWMLWPLLLH